MDTLTKKYIFEQKLKGEPIKIPNTNTPWLEEIKHLDILVECGILEEGEGGRGRFWVRYPILFHGSDHGIDKDGWRTIEPGLRLAQSGDEWDLRDD